MAKNKVHIDNDLIQDLKTYSSSICTALAAQVRDEMYKEAQFAIEEFYNDYDPLYYKRHYYNFRKNSFIKYYKNPHNSIVRGGIELTPYNMDDIYRAEKEYVFNLVYLGYHGHVQSFPHEIFNIPPRTKPSPYDILLRKRRNLIRNISDYENKAIDKANKKTYKTLLF